jgi:hypothetical protein
MLYLGVLLCVFYDEQRLAGDLFACLLLAVSLSLTPDALRFFFNFFLGFWILLR